MALFNYILPVVALIIVCCCQEIYSQRPPYAGSRPVGYKDRFRPKPSSAPSSINDIDNRFGENDIDNNKIQGTQKPPTGVDIVYGEPGEQIIQQQPQQQTLQTIQQQQQQGNINTSNLGTDLFTGGQQSPVAAPAVSGSPFISTVSPVFTPTVTPHPHIPYDAHGDIFLVNLLNRRPVDQRPFWLVNYQAIEAHRNGK